MNYKLGDVIKMTHDDEAKNFHVEIIAVSSLYPDLYKAINRQSGEIYWIVRRGSEGEKVLLDALVDLDSVMDCENTSD